MGRVMGLQMLFREHTYVQTMPGYGARDDKEYSKVDPTMRLGIKCGKVECSEV